MMELNNALALAEEIGIDINALRISMARQQELLNSLMLLNTSQATTSVQISATDLPSTLNSSISRGKVILSGMDDKTGKLITGIPYLRQRIYDCLTTEKGSQVLCRGRGSELREFLDSPMSGLVLAKLISGITKTISHPLSGVPDFKITKVRIEKITMSGDLGISLSGRWLGNSIELSL